MLNQMTPKRWTIGELLRVTADYLAAKGIDSPRLSSEVLLAHSLGVDRIDLFLSFDKPLTDQEISRYRALVKRRVRREPVQYITGKQEFWSMEFMVNPHVLIPRPESELLVECAISIHGEAPGPAEEGVIILDLGTGCGALAVALAKELERATIWATDISDQALEVARENARRHGVDGKINFRKGDLFGALGEEEIRFDIIMSNPPYVPSDSFQSLQPEIRDYEPRTALDGGAGGTDHIERIIKDGAGYLKCGGWLLLEMGPEQISGALQVLESNDLYGENKIVKDYSRQYRVLMARKRKQPSQYGGDLGGVVKGANSG
ncbi:MAG: peptide chain release factor N(5)-glutamine methyltransferase [Deltaproteobacteria bacterium]|nr:peptide chain release factor N(5)-glutamine methyltransferase [Deltaproteobacteria bacterium]